MMRDGEIQVGGYLTGPGLPVFVRGLDIGGGGIIVQDQQAPNADTLRFGRDFTAPPVWKLEFCIGEGAGAEEALRALAALQSAWNTAVDRRAPGAVTELRYGAAGRTRMIYGRPRNFLPNVSESLEDGHVVATAEFQAQDTLHYSEEWESRTVSLVPGVSGGLRSPLVSPLTTVAGGTRYGAITVGGDAPTPVEVLFRGPVTAPKVSSGGWEVGLTTALAYDETALFDARTGAVTRNDGASLSGAVTRGTYLPEARLVPGAHEIIYSGTDHTGTSSATVSWRPAYQSF